MLTEHQEQLFKNENNNKKEVFAEFRRPVQTDSEHEREPTLPFNPCTYWVVLGAAHPSPTPEPRNTPALSVIPFSTYWRQKKVQFTLTFTAPLKGDLQIKEKSSTFSIMCQMPPK